MEHRSKIYWVEVWENGKAQKVPHTKGTKYYDFISRAQAITFKDQLVLSNPKNKFRLCKKSITITNEDWCSVNKRLQPKPNHP